MSERHSPPNNLRIGIISPRPADATTGGAERLWRALAARLRARGHSCELESIPVVESTLDEVLSSYDHFRELDVSRFDLVITGKYPAWMVDHPRHLVYMLHPLRGVYDTYPVGLGELEDELQYRGVMSQIEAAGPDTGAIIEIARRHLASLPSGHHDLQIQRPFGRWLVKRLDQLAFAQVDSFAAISETVAARPGYLPADQPILVAHPETDLPLIEDDLDPTTTFFTASRLDRPKRIDLIIRGFRRLHDSAAQLLIAGDGPERAALEKEAAGDRRIVFLGRVADDELARHYATATAVVFAPQDEDFGYIALEAMRAGTPVITTTDSGGPTELVEHNTNGLVVDPTDDEIRWAMEHLSSLPHLRWRFGLAARRRAAMVSWDRLLDSIDEIAAPVERPTALVLSTYGVEPAIGGGQRRARHLDVALSRRLDVTLLVLSSSTDVVKRRRLETGLVQVEIPRSPAQRRAEDDIYAFIELPVDDLTISALAPATPDFGTELSSQLQRADLVVTTHPFLVPALPPLAQPLVYDSQNAEAQMKAQLLPDSDGGRWLLEHAERSEAEAAERADLVTACTEDDLATISALAPHRQLPGIVVENGVDTAAMPRRLPGDQQHARLEALSLANIDVHDDRPYALFIGSWHPPNLDAARLILELAEARPDFLFILAGSHSSEFAAGPLPSNVHCISIFPEPALWPLLAGADVGMNPMISGGGSNLKIFDYLSVGVPVLSTPIGARGLDDPSTVMEIAEATVSALSDGLDRLMAGANQELVDQRVERGRRLVEQAFDWRVLGERWADSLAGLVAGDSVAPRPWPASDLHPVLSHDPPPSAVPSIAIMRLVGQRARTLPPPPQEITMDPALRESIKRAADNRRVGQQLPPGARFRLPKEAVIRTGKVLSNEQANFNQAAIESLENLGAQLFDLRASHERLEARVDAAEEHSAMLEKQLDSLQVWRGSIGNQPTISAPPVGTPTDSGSPRQNSGPELDRFYQAFEDSFRGSRVEVKELLAEHLSTVVATGGPVVDVGCGRGEWLEILADAGVEALGIDTNALAVERATELGLEARVGDAIAELHAIEPSSIGVVTAFHLVEHLPSAVRYELANAAFRALRPGGLFLMETPNALNLQVGASSIWLDPTHLHPIHPSQLEFLLVHLGFTEVSVQPLHPGPEDIELPTLADEPDRDSFLTQMAKMVYGSHDVAVSGRKPGGRSSRV